jgi:hypothetical protein
MRSRGERRLADIVEQTKAHLESGRRRSAERVASDGQDGKLQMLGRVRDFHHQTLFPIIRRKQEVVRGIGSIRVDEDIEKLHALPRAIVHFDSIDAGPDAPRACMTFHIAEDGAAILARNYLRPVKNTEVTVRRLDDLSPELVEEAIDEFLIKALGG